LCAAASSAAAVSWGKLDIEIKDRFGQPLAQQEWCVLSLFVTDEAVKPINEGSSSGGKYDPVSAKLVRRVEWDVPHPHA
jgi:hypothetical protein